MWIRKSPWFASSGGSLKIRDFTAFLVLALVIPALFSVKSMTVDNRLERWEGSNRHQAEVYDDFKAAFGSDEFVLIVLWDGTLFQPEALDTMMDVADSLEKIPGVTRVQGLPVVYRDLFAGEDIEALEEEMTGTPFYRDLFISSDGKTAAISATVTPPDTPLGRRMIMNSVHEAIRPLEEAGFTVGLVGAASMIDALDRMSKYESLRSIAVALILSLLALALLSRSVRVMAVGGVCAGVAVVLTMALVVVTGHSLNMINSVLPGLLWVLSLAGIIHLVRRVRHHLADHNMDRALSHALADTTRPIVLASITTAAGFLSLMAAGMAPVRELGLFAAIGILLTLVVNLTVGPLFIRLMRVPAMPASTDEDFHGRWLHLGSNRPRTVIGIALLLVMAAVISLPFIRVASNPLGFLPQDHPTNRDYRPVANTLGGFFTLEVILDLPSRWTDPALWGTIDGLTDDLGNSPIIPRVISPLDMLRKLQQWDDSGESASYRLPNSQDDAQYLLGHLSQSGRQMLSALIAHDGTTIRLSAVVNDTDELSFLDLVEQVRLDLGGLPSGFSGHITGQALQLIEARQTLVTSQLRSLGLALVVIFSVIAVGLRSLKLTALSVLPNVVPILSAFGLMAMRGIALDAATIMVASIALGIAVDDTVHLLVAIDREKGNGESIDRVRHALEHVGPALVLTTGVTCTAFFSLMTSNFPPIRYFGLLSGVAIVVALAADLWLVPALLVVFIRKVDSNE